MLKLNVISAIVSLGTTLLLAAGEIKLSVVALQSKYAKCQTPISMRVRQFVDPAEYCFPLPQRSLSKGRF